MTTHAIKHKAKNLRLQRLNTKESGIDKKSRRGETRHAWFIRSLRRRFTLVRQRRLDSCPAREDNRIARRQDTISSYSLFPMNQCPLNTKTQNRCIYASEPVDHCCTRWSILGATRFSITTRFQVLPKLLLQHPRSRHCSDPLDPNRCTARRPPDGSRCTPSRPPPNVRSCAASRSPLSLVPAPVFVAQHNS